MKEGKAQFGTSSPVHKLMFKKKAKMSSQMPHVSSAMSQLVLKGHHEAVTYDLDMRVRTCALKLYNICETGLLTKLAPGDI